MVKVKQAKGLACTLKYNMHINDQQVKRFKRKALIDFFHVIFNRSMQADVLEILVKKSIAVQSNKVTG